MSDGHKCERCGEYERGRWMRDFAERLAETRRCFTCDFWEDYERTTDDPAHIIHDGIHYVIGPEDARGSRGFAGRRFHIKFNDGREVTTSNLWCQGRIPPRFRENMPDNAEFHMESNPDA